MTNRFFVLLLAFSLLVPVKLGAQVGNLLKNKLKTTEKNSTTEAGKKAESKTVSLKDRLLGSILEEEVADSLQTEEGVEAQDAGMPAINPMKALFSGGASVKHKESYNFNGKIRMLMESYEEKGNNADAVVEYITYIDEGSGDVAIEVVPISGELVKGGGSAAMNMIYDQENMAMFILTDKDGQKTAIATPIDESMQSAGIEEDEEISDEATFNRTGRTKTIAGYKCEEYEMKDGTSTANMWVTKDLPFKPSGKEMRSAGIPIYNEGPFDGGMIMEMVLFEEGVKKMTMVVKEVDNRAKKSISLAGYTIMNMNVGGRN